MESGIGCGFKRLYKRGDISGLKKSNARWSGPLIGKLQITITAGSTFDCIAHMLLEEVVDRDHVNVWMKRW